MALTLKSASLLARPGFAEQAGQVAKEFASAPAIGRRRGMLTDLLGTALDTTATPEQLRQSVSGALQIGERELASQIAARLSAEEQAAQLEKGRANLETAAIAKARRDGAGEGVIAGLKGMGAEALRTYLATPKARETLTGTPGTTFFERNEAGQLEPVAKVPFKDDPAPASKGIKTVERPDGSVSVLSADDGSLISTLPPPDKGEGDRDAALNLIAQTTSFIQDVDSLMDPGFSETGFIGGVTSMVAGFPAYDREKELLSIRARLGFDQINEMKRLADESGASGTGLGQISNIEFMSLQSTIDAIYVGMSAEAQKKALESIKGHLLNVQKLASGIAPADAIDWKMPEYKAVGYHQDPVTKTVYYAPDGRQGTVYKLANGEFVKLGALVGSTRVE